MSLLQIMEGWKNHLVPSEELKDIVAAVQKERIAICSECAYHSSKHVTLRTDRHCTVCKCPEGPKTACLTCSCPLSPPKWNEVDVESLNTDDNDGE